MQSSETRYLPHIPARVRRAFYISGLLGIATALIFAHGFLAVSSPVGRGLLVVEAWVPPQSLTDAARIFQSGRYDCLVLISTTTAPRVQAPTSTQISRDPAETWATMLNVDPKRVVRLEAVTSKNRTFSSALVLKEWLHGSGLATNSLDVFTEGVHARKSWILFRYALGRDYDVGVIAGPEHSYDPRLWPLSPRGVHIVLRNIAGYIYFKFAILLDGFKYRMLARA